MLAELEHASTARPTVPGRHDRPGAADRVSELARGLLLLLAVVLPFEAPLFRVGPLQITTVEAALYAALAAWAAALAIEVHRDWKGATSAAMEALRGDRMVQAALLWVAVTFASGLVAPTDRPAALKFGLRTLSGVLAFFAVRSLARRPEVGRRLLLALLFGALLSAATAAVDSLVPSSGLLWRPFRLGRFTALGLTRASGAFGYPTIGAMYWEAALPLLLVAPFLGKEGCSGRRRTRGPAFVLLASALLVGAILASATRSALVGAAVSTAGAAVLAWKSGVAIRQAAAAILGVIVLYCAVPLGTTAFGALLGQRLRWWHDDAWVRAEYSVEATPRTVFVGELFTVPMRLRNTGTVRWTREGSHPFRLGYHWIQPTGGPVRADSEGIRTELPEDVPPGGIVELEGTARGPDDEGRYLLQWDLVQEGVTWFGARGNAAAEQQVDVIAAWEDDEFLPVQPVQEEVLAASAPSPSPSRFALWRAAVVLWRSRPLLGIGADNFRRRYEAVLSPGPNGEPYADERIHANSIYFETLADLGLAGVAALALLVVALAHSLRAHYAKSCLTGLGAGVAAAAFFVHGALDYFLEFTPLFGLFWVLLGLSAASAPGASRAEALQGSTQSDRAR